MYYNLKMDIQKKKKITAGLSIVSNITLTVLKVAVGIISGSMSIISEAVHSVSDLFASVLTLFSVIKSSKPADDDHPYGHGKYEDMSGFIEGFLIIAAAIFIIYKSLMKIISGELSDTQNNLGITVMFIAVVMNIIVSTLLFRVAKETESLSLYADGEHLRTDVYSSLGVLAGLILIKITGYSVLDPIIAIMVAMLIYKAGYIISKKAWMRLVDYSLPKEDIEKIENIINGFSDIVVLKENGIKARQVGAAKDIDLVLQFPEKTSICECHKICDEIETQIRKIYINSSISIHYEPVCYKKNCQNYCGMNCCSDSDSK